MDNSIKDIWENKQDLEDYEQFITELKLRGKKGNFIDFLRTIYGRKNSSQYETRKNIINALPLSFCKKENHSIPDFDKKIEKFDYIFKKLGNNVNYRIILVLIIYGFTFREIGFCLNVTEGYVSVIVKKIISKIKKYHPTFDLE